MNPITRFLHFWYDFVVGDDWTVAVGVVIALIVTALLAGGGIAAWWVLPVAVVLLLGLSLRRASRPSA
ncbi:hypothetical protein [Actinacidiphila oryziradicis]|uniref:hypothetical protein n=1 Tax=Actinacidiphila oryziradicis TaxID=2571141 RepID=UPI0023F1447A|nr:hypothetical protein [Actinacidiphila oryziradicis]MCW2874310.1 hypothetical protein [Actinacidiphila oryziradicis]